ncbi:MAG TPA: hypothetical protein VJA26_13000 [Gammaproteobacteria bacterium]|nr:hypothetical protein [Gammaproteobacteria bacterium]
MKYLLLVALSGLAGCGASPLAMDNDGIVSQDRSCDVSYPQLPRCECGCAGDICTTGSLGVVVCDSGRTRSQMIVPIRTASFK